MFNSRLQHFTNVSTYQVQSADVLSKLLSERSEAKEWTAVKKFVSSDFSREPRKKGPASPDASKLIHAE
jgi:hypothetical protein